MLNDAAGFEHVYIATGFTDLRHGIEGLTAIIRGSFHLDPCAQKTLFLFCGRRSDRIKGVLYDGDGFLLLYKRYADGRLQWPRTADDVRDLTPEEYHRLITGFSIETTVRMFTPKRQ